MRARLLPAHLRRLVPALALALLVPLVPHGAAQAGAARHEHEFYRQTNLVSDIPGVADVTDPNLVNPWGMSASSSSPIWVSNAGTGTSTLYDGAGDPFPVATPLVVTIPAAPGAATAPVLPTGQVFDNGAPTDFMVTQGGKSGHSIFIFVTINGTIAGWSPAVDVTHAILAVNNTGTAVYTGLAIGTSGARTYLYAANFRAGSIDVFDAQFAPAHLAGAFVDPQLPSGYAPFNIQNLGGKLYVAYAIPGPRGSVNGAGNGVVDVFDTNGAFLQRLAAGGALNSPWGLAVAPAHFGLFSHDLLVGNFGDGRITALDPSSGAVLGQLMNHRGKPITIEGLWALLPGNGANGGARDQVFFSAGIGHEQHGLFGALASPDDQDHHDDQE